MEERTELARPTDGVCGGGSADPAAGDSIMGGVLICRDDKEDEEGEGAGAALVLMDSPWAVFIARGKSEASLSPASLDTSGLTLVADSGARPFAASSEVEKSIADFADLTFNMVVSVLIAPFGGVEDNENSCEENVFALWVPAGSDAVADNNLHVDGWVDEDEVTVRH